MQNYMYKAVRTALEQGQACWGRERMDVVF